MVYGGTAAAYPDSVLTLSVRDIRRGPVQERLDAEAGKLARDPPSSLDITPASEDAAPFINRALLPLHNAIPRAAVMLQLAQQQLLDLLTSCQFNLGARGCAL